MGSSFHLRGGGVLPPTPPIPDSEPPIPDSEPPVPEKFRDLFEDFNRDELPPLELIEEDDIPRMEETQRTSGQDGDATSSRPPRQLRNRNVARSVKGSRMSYFVNSLIALNRINVFEKRSKMKVGKRYSLPPDIGMI